MTAGRSQGTGLPCACAITRNGGSHVPSLYYRARGDAVQLASRAAVAASLGQHATASTLRSALHEQAVADGMPAAASAGNTTAMAAEHAVRKQHDSLWQIEPGQPIDIQLSALKAQLAAAHKEVGGARPLRPGSAARQLSSIPPSPLRVPPPCPPTAAPAG